MYILKKLNREKKVGTAAEVAVLQNKGWKVVKEPWKEPELKETEKTSELESKPEDNEPDADANQKQESDNEPDADANQKQESDNEPDVDADQKQESDNEPDVDAEPEKKTSTRSRKKD